MNWWNFFRLMRTIYGKGLPDLDLIQRLGLLAVKIGQTYALRIDFLNEDTCKHLSRLYSHTDRMSAEDFKTLLDENTSDEWRSHFSSIDREPLASASVGQVHRAVLKTGEQVVVKLIKQNFHAQFEADIKSLRRLVKLAIFFYPKLQKVADPMGILDTISWSTLSELDLRNEMQGQRTLRAIYEKHTDSFDLSKQRFPKIFEDLGSESVMVSEYIEGKTFDALLGEGALDYSRMLELFHIHGFYLFCIGTFHGDIHPGNIILKDGGIYFLDTGAISVVSDKMRKGLFMFFDALSQYDYEKSAHFLNKMAEKEISGEAYERYLAKFLNLYRDFTNATISQVSLTRRMMETIKLGVHSGMVFEKGMYPIIKSLMYLDGMVLRCRPDAVLMRDVRSFVEEFRNAVL